MIVRVIFTLFAVVAMVVTVRRKRRSKHDPVPTLTVRGGDTDLENVTYRIVIELGGSDDEPTFTWSREGERGSPRHNIPVQPGVWVPLENGIELRFDGTTFDAGDSWTIPARRAADTVTTKARRRRAPSARDRATRRR